MGVTSSFLHSFSNRAGMPSGPGDALFFRSLMAVISSGINRMSVKFISSAISAGKKNFQENIVLLCSGVLYTVVYWCCKRLAISYIWSTSCPFSFSSGPIFALTVNFFLAKKSKSTLGSPLLLPLLLSLLSLSGFHESFRVFSSSIIFSSRMEFLQFSLDNSSIFFL